MDKKRCENITTHPIRRAFNHGKTKSATLQKRNVIFKAKTKCTKITEKATHLSGFFHLFKRYSNNIQKEQYIV